MAVCKDLHLCWDSNWVSIFVNLQIPLWKKKKQKKSCMTWYGNSKTYAYALYFCFLWISDGSFLLVLSWSCCKMTLLPLALVLLLVNQDRENRENRETHSIFMAFTSHFPFWNFLRYEFLGVSKYFVFQIQNLLLVCSFFYWSVMLSQSFSSLVCKIEIWVPGCVNLIVETLNRL